MFHKPIKRHPNNINWSSTSVVDFEHVFVCSGIFKSNHSEKLWKMTLLQHLNFQGKYMVQFLYNSFLFCLQKKPETLRILYSSKDLTLQVECIKYFLIFRSSRPDVFLRNFAKFIGKHLCGSLDFNKVADPTLLK